MDDCLSDKFLRFGGAVLSLALACGTTAADDSSSMVVVMATDGAQASAVAASEPDEPTELLVHVSDDAPAATPSAGALVAPRAPAARGELTVVANAVGSNDGSAMISDAQVIPASGSQGSRPRKSGLTLGRVLGFGAQRPDAASGVQGQRPTPAQGVSQPSEVDAEWAYETDESNELAQLIEPVVSERRDSAPAATMQPIKSPVDHAKGLLVSAYQLSLSASNEGQYSEIIQLCSTALRTELDDESRQFGANLAAWALNRRGQQRADEDQTDLALADFGAAIELAPNNWRALHNRGVTMAQTGQFAEAFDDLCRVIQLNPKFAKAYSNRGTLYVQAGQVDRALADYEAALAINPDLLQALVGRGRLCHQQGKLQDALDCLNAAVEAVPEDAEIVCSRADLLADLGRYEDALLDYAQAIDLNSKFEHAYRNGAWLLATCPEDAIRDVEGALAGAKAALECGYGERHAALDTLAAALANAGQFEEAVGTIQQAIEVAPEGSRAAYAARQQLYEARQPYRSQPVGVAVVETEANSLVAEPSDDAQAAVYVEE